MHNDFVIPRSEKPHQSAVDLLKQKFIAEDRSALMRMPEIQWHRDRWDESWFRAGAVVTNAEGKYLFVEEKRAKGDDGKFHNVHDIWNIPSGCAKPGEGIDQTGCREVGEEAGMRIHLTGILLIIHSSDPQDPYIYIIFTAELSGEIGDYDHEEIRSHQWLSWGQAKCFQAQKKLRSEKTVIQALENHRRGLIMPLEMLFVKPVKF